MEQNFVFDDALFTYAISADPFPCFRQHTAIFGGALTVHHTAATEVHVAAEGEREIAVIGLCVDGEGELAREDIPAWLLGLAGEGIEAVYRHSARLAGKHVILCQGAGGRFLFGDATCSVPIYYTQADAPFCAACFDHLVATHLGIEPSPAAAAIRKGSDLSQPMPGDLSLFEPVKALLPNHYLDIRQGSAVRVPVPAGETVRTEEGLRAVVERSATLIENTLQAYLKVYDIVCPITSGYDSRVNLAFLKEAVPDLECYTFRHPGFTDETGDLRIPSQLCARLGLRHTVIPDLKASDALYEAVREAAGPFVARGALDLACTYLSRFRGKALVNGDIMGQVGQSSLATWLPSSCATASFFQCKTHNTAPGTRLAMRQYIAELHACGQYAQSFDLFAIESRCGRWAAQGSALYALLGIPSLNLFNCRAFLSACMSLDRKLRARQVYHKALLSTQDPTLLDVPFNPDSKLQVLTNYAPTFFLATYGKFYLQWLRDRL